MKAPLRIVTMIALAVTAVAENQRPLIVKNGVAMAEIVVAEKPPRKTAMAAEELRDYVKKISNAELPIVTSPGDAPVRIYVGASDLTDKLGVTTEGLKNGAFKMVSGPNYLVLLGDDFDFEPKKPFTMKGSPNSPDRKRMVREWDAITGAYWQNPMRSVNRFYNKDAKVWFHDGSGSFNAVCAFLRSLGVRWYMPGELGEIVPKMATIILPNMNETVIPDYPLRRWFGAYMAFDENTLKWDMRLGINSGYQTLGAGMHVHGMRLITSRPELFELHPEYFALDHNGKRNPHHACFSSTGLANECVRFARTVFDHFDEPQVSLWPNDGLRQCQCPLCEGLKPSDACWGFIDRVAREVYKTHPDKWISAGAYSAYRQPPKSIEKLSPNVLVFVAAHRPGLDHPEQWRERMELIDGWLKRTGPRRLIRNSNNYYDLVFHPRSFARELKALKGISLGDWNEVRRSSKVFPDKGKKVVWTTPGVDHLNQYVNARFLWDADQDLDQLLDEYYELFYGPAKNEMKTALEYAENNYTRPGQAKFNDLEKRIRFVELLNAAKKKAGDGVYAQRIQLIIDAIQPLERMRNALEMKKKRGDARLCDITINLRNDKWNNMRDTLVMDGEIEEPFWTAYSNSPGLSECSTGRNAFYGTRFLARWYQNNLYIAIRCEENTDEPLATNAVERDDPAILDDDHVEILLETNVNSYYLIAVNPAGALLDMNMGENGEAARKWSSEAEVATHVGDGYWSVEIKIPVLGEQEGMLDPLHNVVGRYPSRTWPWFFNIGRVRVRDGERRAYAYQPTGTNSLRDKLRFAKFSVR